MVQHRKLPGRSDSEKRPPIEHPARIRDAVEVAVCAADQTAVWEIGEIGFGSRERVQHAPLAVRGDLENPTESAGRALCDNAVKLAIRALAKLADRRLG